MTMTEVTETRRIELVMHNTNRKTEVQPFPFSLQSCKRAFTTRNVNSNNIKTLITGNIKPQSGDLVLCKVTRLRQHCRIEQPNGRRSRMFVNDKIIICYGNRYAPDQFEAIVPENLAACHLVAGGGIAAQMRHKSPKVKPATEIQPLGLIGNESGHILNLKDFSILNNQRKDQKNNIPVLLVTGSSMNAGKTTTVASLVNGLSSDGFIVTTAKVTGTGSGGDLWHFIDAGVSQAIDFTDAGFASTYLMSNEKVIKIFNNMLNHMLTQNPDIMVIEVADGVLQRETKKLLESNEIVQATTAMIYTASDSTSAIYGTKLLEELGYDVIAISGVVSSNPLGIQEIEQSISAPVLNKSAISTPGFGHQLMQSLTDKSKQSGQLHTRQQT